MTDYKGGGRDRYWIMEVYEEIWASIPEKWSPNWLPEGKDYMRRVERREQES